MKRHNLPQEVVGVLFGYDRSAVSRQCEFIDAALEAVLPGITAMGKRLRGIKTSEEFLKFTGGGLQTDGTFVPAEKSKDKDNPDTSGFSGKHKAHGFNVGLTVTETGLFVHVESGPGNEHDYHMFKRSPLKLGLFNMTKKPESAEEIIVMAKTLLSCDKAYVGMKADFPDTNSNIPHKGKNKQTSKEIRKAYKTQDVKQIARALGLTPEQYAENKEISKRRSFIERKIGSAKRWRVTAGPYPGTASDLKQQFEIVCGVLNLRTLWSEIEQNEAPLLAKLAEKRAKYTKSR